MFKTILVPTDGSAPATRAIKQAVQLAAEQNARIVGFYVGPPWTMPVYDEYVPRGALSPKQHARTVHNAALRHFTQLRNAARAAGVRVRFAHVMAEYPAQEIVKAARAKHCDLIVIASHGRSGLSRLLLGSETSKVLALSSIPVMVCR